MRGASITFQVTSQLAAVLEIWEQDAFAWGFNPGCWSLFGPPTGCTSAVTHSEHRGPVTTAPHLMAPNLPPDQNMDLSMSDVTREMTEAEVCVSIQRTLQSMTDLARRDICISILTCLLRLDVQPKFCHRSIPAQMKGLFTPDCRKPGIERGA
jgi:hypothetical protein